MFQRISNNFVWLQCSYCINLFRCFSNKQGMRLNSFFIYHSAVFNFNTTKNKRSFIQMSTQWLSNWHTYFVIPVRVDHISIFSGMFEFQIDIHWQTAYTTAMYSIRQYGVYNRSCIRQDSISKSVVPQTLSVLLVC